MGNRPDHADLVKRALSDRKTLEFYKDLEEEFSILKEFIQARRKSGKTQAEVAQRMRTKTSSIGRFESSLVQSRHSPSLSTLRKYAKAIGYRIEMHLKELPHENTR